MSPTQKTQTIQTPFRNQLIDRLPKRDRARLLAACEPVRLGLSDVLCEPGQKPQHAYFPTEGFISLITHVDQHPGLEVGMVGCEGMLGAALVLGVNAAPAQAVVQGGGASWRITESAFRRELAASAPLRAHLLRYVYVVVTQMISAAGCLHYHPIGQRLARWLLMSQDRAQGDHFYMTHEFLATMLGVRRVGITLAAGDLHRRGLITYHRGNLSVLDRPGLEAAACGCYARDRALYALHLG